MGRFVFRTVCLTAALVSILSLGGCRRSAQDHLKTADQFFKDKKYQDASLNYRKAIQQDGKLGEAYYGLGLSELEQDNGPVAYESLRQAAQLLPDRMDVKTKLADLMLAAYQATPQNNSLYESLRKLTDEMSAKDANSFDALRMKGNLALLDRKADQAIVFFKKANEIQPLQEFLVIGYAQALIDNGQPDEAVALGRQLIAKKKDFAPIYDLLYRNAMANKRESEAEAVLKEKAQNNPGKPEAALQLAAHYARGGKTEAMQSTLQSILAAQPAVPKAHAVVGDFHIRMRNLDQALAVYEQGLKASPDQSNTLQVRIASVRVVQNRMDEALAILDGVLAKAPADHDAAMLKANLLLERGKREDLDKAIALYDVVLKAQPKDAAAKLNLGRAYLGKGDLVAARKNLQDAAQESAAADLPKMLLATVNILDKKPTDAVSSLDEVIGRNPKDGRARFLKFAALMELKRYEDAQPVLDSLVADYPRSRDLRVQQGLLAIAMKRYKDAETVFNRLATEQYDAKAVAGLAETYVAQQQFERAMKILSEEVNKNPKADMLRLMMAKTAMQAGNYDKAIGDFQELRAANPQNASLTMELGNAYREKGDMPKAIEELQKASQLNPKDPITHLALGMAQYSSGRNAEAIRSYRQALSLQPSNPIVMNNLAYSLAESASGPELEEALQIGQKAVQLRPKELDYKDTLGWVYLKKKNVDSAIQLFQSLCKEMPANPSYQHHLGVALMAKNDAVGARKALETALQNRPAATEEAEIRKALAALGGR
ncbi:MAG: tetratricopeptide repeat protein [Bryobacterales bacterium]|nr:tetratricopeptide repeat protein [Bryobacterales bacterium]